MSDEQEQAPEVPGTKVADEIKRQVKESVAQKHADNEVRRRVVEQLAEEQVAERVTLLRKALAKREELARNTYKMTADVVTYDAEGKTVAATFTKPRLEERNKAIRALEDMDRAIEKAVKSADYEGVRKLA